MVKIKMLADYLIGFLMGSISLLVMEVFVLFVLRKPLQKFILNYVRNKFFETISGICEDETQHK